MASKEQSHARHFLIVATCCLIMMSGTGMVFSVSGIFYPSLCEEFGIGRGQASLWVTISLLVAFLSLPFVGKQFNKGNRKWIICVGALLVGGGMMAFSAASSIYVFYTCAIFIGFGMTILGYVAVPGLINRWFKAKSGLMIGICMAFSGVGGAIYNPLASSIIANQGWRHAYLVLGILVLVQVIPITLLVVVDEPASVGLRPYGDDGKETAEASGAGKPAEGVPASVAMRSAAFWLILVFAGVCAFGSSIYQYMPSYVLALPIGESTPGIAATIASVVMVSQAVGKVCLGYVSDKNPVITIVLSVVCGACGLLLLWLVPVSVTMVLVAGALFGVYYSTTMVVVPALTRLVFGMRDFDTIYSRFNMVIALSAAFSVTLMGFMVDATGSFTVLWLLGLALVAVELFSGLGGLKASERLPREG